MRAWGCSSAGRALPSQGRGRGFESLHLHHGICGARAHSLGPFFLSRFQARWEHGRDGRSSRQAGRILLRRLRAVPASLRCRALPGQGGRLRRHRHPARRKGCAPLLGGAAHLGRGRLGRNLLHGLPAALPLLPEPPDIPGGVWPCRFHLAHRRDDARAAGPGRTQHQPRDAVALCAYSARGGASRPRERPCHPHGLQHLGL